VRSSVDNMLNFTANIPNEWQKKWEKNLNVKPSKLTSKAKIIHDSPITEKKLKKLVRQING
jgi:hypothetical protein